MIVVADTTPLNYLVLIGAIDVLPKLFESVIVPPSVVSEMTRLKTPPAVKAWASSLPAWLNTIAPAGRLPSTSALGDGEADAISLAKEQQILQVLIDERAGRKIAQREGLIVIPTLALLEHAAASKLLDFQSALDLLLQTNFRIPQKEIDAALLRNTAREQL